MNRKRLAAAAASLTMIASMAAALPVSAVDYSPVLITAEQLKTATLDKYLVMRQGANVPNAEFTFTVSTPIKTSATETNDAVLYSEGAQIQAADAEKGTLEVFAGIGTPVLKFDTEQALDGSITLTFSDADNSAVILEQNHGTDTPVFATAGDEDDPANADEQYVKKTLSLDFSDVVFTEPGVYRYLITESGNNQGITNGYTGQSSAETCRTLDVYVEDADTPVTEAGEHKGKPQLRIAEYVMYEGNVTGAPNKNIGTGKDKADNPNGAEVSGATKSSSITNLYTTQDLKIGKVVTGNQGSKDKYFKFTVEIAGITVENTKFSVVLTAADRAVPAAADLNKATNPEYAGKSNPDELSAETAVDLDEDGKTDFYKVTAEYYLQNGQYITIQGIPQNASYTVSETAEDYTAKKANEIMGTGDNAEKIVGFKIGDLTFIDETSGSIQNSDILTGFSNDRSGTIPTGVLLAVAAPAAIGMIALIGIAYLLLKNARRKNEDA